MATIIIKGADFSAQALPLANKDVFNMANVDSGNIYQRVSTTPAEDDSYELRVNSYPSYDRLLPVRILRQYNYLKIVKGDKQFIAYKGNDLSKCFVIDSNGNVTTNASFYDGINCEMSNLGDYDYLYINISGHLTDDMQIIFSMEQIA